jgi:hypothetical protein
MSVKKGRGARLGAADGPRGRQDGSDVRAAALDGAAYWGV